MTSLSSVRADVEALAAFERGSATGGERSSAAWGAARLEEAGASDVRTEPFRYQHSYGLVHALHLAAAATGRPGALAALLSFELDFSGRGQPLRQLLPAGEGANVVARVPARGEAERKLVLVAHHDAANTGLVWRLPLSALGASAQGTLPFTTVAELAMATMAVGPRRLRRPTRALLALVGGLMLDVERGPTVPGASDNATGVAAVIELTARLAVDPLPNTEVLVLLPGCEEPGMGGMAAWMRGAGAALDPRRTLVLGLDTLGAGEPIVVSSEGPLWRVRYRRSDLELADRGAQRASLAPPRRFRIGGYTDPALARLAGLPAISLLSLKGSSFTDYHLPTDTPDRVDWQSVERCLAIAHETIRVWAD